MFSTLTKSLRHKSQPDTSSPVRSARTIVFPNDANLSPSFHGAGFLPRRTSYDVDEHGSELDESEENSDEEEEGDEGEHEEAVSSHDDGEDLNEDTPLLPLFSSAHLSTLPVFTLTHNFRDMVLDRCDTVLSWEQLRSPQVSQFLIKPIQQEIRDNHMSAAAVSALLANCLQFTKEANNHPGNSGTNRTRAMVCELIAIRLLREYTTRELIDALSYDFDPLQGQFQQQRPNDFHAAKQTPYRAVRISCVEIAIRAGSKRFLAHPLVVQHLEAIWNGSIVFHSAADSLHRKPASPPMTSYGTTGRSASVSTPFILPNKKEVTLYNPRDASLFKLSRLRVPRYRNVLSTISFAVLLALFLSVLKNRSLSITPLEVVFWVWTAGYMLDEVIGFNEQGFSLYIASFWNTFDVGILMLLFIHLCLRLYGVLAPLDEVRSVYIAHRSYDVLALSAILVFPRLFSVLDHYRYFSTLIIAFRMMASDMLAVFFLIIIFCSGFLVALTFAFGYDTVDDPQSVAYALLQMLLGFTPAAWERWPEYNWMGKFVLILFLIVCHFVVVTILITVLTNSFLEIVRNANEEHQYLFAVNTIANVKSDALFAYIPPLNVLQWLLTPLRYLLPFKEYIKLNRTIIKATHFPILFAIYSYEKLVLRSRYFDGIDLVESSRGHTRRILAEKIPRMIRKSSMATIRQEAALEEVFRRRANTTVRTHTSQEQRKNTTVVSHWMQTVEEDAEPPREPDRKQGDRLEQRRRFGARRVPTFDNRDRSASRRPTSIASDPYDFASHGFLSPRGPLAPMVDLTPSAVGMSHQRTPPVRNEKSQLYNHDKVGKVDNELEVSLHRNQHHDDYFSSKIGDDSTRSEHDQSVHQQARTFDNVITEARPGHARNVSSATMIYHAPSEAAQEEQPGLKPEEDPRHLNSSTSELPTAVFKSDSGPSSQKAGKRLHRDRLRPVLPHQDQQAFRSVPNIGNLTSKARPIQRLDDLQVKDHHTSLEMDLVSDIGDNKAIGGGYVGAIPASFASRMAQATNALRYSRDEQMRKNEDAERFGRLMMARMNSLEEGFREVVHEVRESMRQGGSGFHSRQRSPDREDPLPSPRKAKRPGNRPESQRGSAGSGTASIASGEKDTIQPVMDSSTGGTSIKQVVESTNRPSEGTHTKREVESKEHLVDNA